MIESDAICNLPGAIKMSDDVKMKELFRYIFERLSKEKFLDDPIVLVEYMDFFGFDCPTIETFKNIVSHEQALLVESLTCSDDEVDAAVERIAHNVPMQTEASEQLVSAIRETMDAELQVEVVSGAIPYCRTLGGGTHFSESMDSIVHVNEDVKAYCIPDFIERIDIQAFYGCSSMKKVIIPDSVKEIWSFAFGECSSLEEVIIPDSVREIKTGAFCGCKSLKRLIISKSVETIGEGAFVGCSDLVIEVDRSNRFFSSSNGALFDADGRSLIVGYALVDNGQCNIPDKVTVIGSRAFEDCIDLKEVTIPDSVTEIGFQAFSGCSSLEVVTIPDSVTEIGHYAFEGCVSLRTVNAPDSLKPYIHIEK